MKPVTQPANSSGIPCKYLVGKCVYNILFHIHKTSSRSPWLSGLVKGCCHQSFDRIIHHAAYKTDFMKDYPQCTRGAVLHPLRRYAPALPRRGAGSRSLTERFVPPRK